eukprot:TRINITY_DN2590_c0_g2_i16.p1 TRINITY_DN2590_c0_g2~~TRINITY_DN2590_c0_g2_i16.p1  ORF type:complete len:593 (-),score=124.14 TRINITY_DN2590_c0_g2_i16:125-1903(-)
MSLTLDKQYAPIPKPERGRSYHLGGDPKERRRIIYTSGQLVIMRSLENPLDVFIYGEHRAPTTCARLAPSGFYVASADESKKIIIWDTVGVDHVIKLEKQTFGKVSDMAWSPDSKRIVACGTGSNSHGDAFMIDGGASVGQLGQHMKPILSIDYRTERPFRLITGSEDQCVNWYEGPPFKFKTQSKKHTRFVSCTRFSPDGSLAVSVGTDKKIVIYDGKTFDFKKEKEDAHSGGIYGVSWAPNGSRFVTVSADKSAKIWDAESLTELTTFNLGEDLSDQQLGCLWQGDSIITVNLAGDIILLDERNPGTPSSVITGHGVVIEALAYDLVNDNFYSADREGKIVGWNRSAGKNWKFGGISHKTRVFGMAVMGSILASVSFDDTCKVTDLVSGVLHEGINLPSQPTGIDARGGWIAVSTQDGVCLIQGEQIVEDNKFDYRPTCVAISADGNTVVVGGGGDKRIHIYENNAGKLVERYSVEHAGGLCSVAISDSGLVAGGDLNRDVCVWDGTTKVCKDWGHSARVDKVRFSPDGVHVASASLDSSFMIWNLSTRNRVFEQRNAHNGGVKDLVWVNANTLLTTGQDIVIKSWNFSG